MKSYKLPFKISLERKYNNINIIYYQKDWEENKNNRKNRTVMVDNDLHIELGKFKTHEISISEIIDLGMRYALQKRDFRAMVAELIALKERN